MARELNAALRLAALLLALTLPALAAPLRCSACGRLILSGTYYRLSDGRVLCPADYDRQAPRCDECGRRLDGRYYRTAEGRTLCEADYERTAPRCIICGRIPSGRYRVLAGNRPVCSSCFASYPHCFLCQAPVPPGEGLRLADGRVLCGPDARRALFDATAARLAFHKAREEVLAALGPGMALEHPVDRVQLVDLQTLRSLARRAGFSAEPITGLFRRRQRGPRLDYTVYLLSGLTPERFLTVASHEYAHAWHSENHPDYGAVEAALQEGFAEWVSYKVNQRLGRTGELEQLTAQAAPEYARGLRFFLEVERRHGVQGVFRVARSRTRL